jgi:hypothetical protein
VIPNLHYLDVKNTLENPDEIRQSRKDAVIIVNLGFGALSPLKNSSFNAICNITKAFS